MSLTNIAMLGILLGFVFLVVGFLMDAPPMDTETVWNKTKKMHKKSKKVMKMQKVLHKKVA